MQKLHTGSSVIHSKATQFQQICLHCGEKVDSPLYSCNCRNEDWVRQYRSTDIKLDKEKMRRQQVQSFQEYSLHNLDGMLQYKGLPYHQGGPEQLETVGVTPLYELRHLGQDFGCRLYLKNEGDNPSGCFKDRETAMCFLNSLNRGLKRSVIYSSGNAAASAASFVEHTDHELITFVAGDTYQEKIDYIRNHGSDVVVIGDKQVNFEDGYRLFSEINDHAIFADYGFDNWSVRNPYRVQGDKTIALEIVKQLSPYKDVAQVPDYVLVPTANGSCLAGIWKGFKELKQAGLIPALPRLVSVGIQGASPVNKAVHLQEVSRPVRCDPSEFSKDGAKVGSIICAEEGYDSIEAAKAVLESEGAAIGIEAADIQDILVDFLEQEGFLAIKQGILPEPAALTSLAAARKLKEELSLSPKETVVSIITGHGLKAVKAINNMLENRPILQKKIKQIMTVRENKMQKPASSEKGRIFKVDPDLSEVEQTFTMLQNKQS